MRERVNAAIPSSLDDYLRRCCNARVPQMPHGRHFVDYEPVTRSRRAPVWEGETGAEWPSHEDVATGESVVEDTVAQEESRLPSAPPKKAARKDNWIARRGHLLSYTGLFLFTAVLYFRPYELFEALSGFSSMAFVLALLTLAVFFPTQIALEGTLTARPREVNLVLLLCLTGLLSIPFARSPAEAWATFSDTFLKAILMFIVMVNVVRTEWRLKGMFFLALAVSGVLSAVALNDYRLGNLTVEGYRVAGFIGGMFENPNDMALHLVTIVPIAVALFLSTRGPLRKMLYGACVLLMLAGIAVTFSRGGFLGLTCAATLMAWKIGRKNRLVVTTMILVLMLAFIVFAPGGYLTRIASIVDHSRDTVGSADARQALLLRSILVAVRNPLFGIGMGNFHIVSFREQVSHNAYTQVASEMGAAAFALYVMFIVTPFKRLREIENQSFAGRRGSRFYYLAIGLQASLVAYMVSSFFASVAYLWYVYYLVGYAICLRRIYAASAREIDKSSASLHAADELKEHKRRALSFDEREAAHG
jgi:putative inorganic carbon (hco3(-)) transporter